MPLLYRDNKVNRKQINQEQQLKEYLTLHCRLSKHCTQKDLKRRRQEKSSDIIIYANIGSRINHD